jgi:hypothetical protein
MRRDMNSVVKSSEFGLLGNFKRRDGIAGVRMQLGDIYDIETPILGVPIFGNVVIPKMSVICVDQTFQSITVATLKGHQEAGVRSFGYTSNGDGSVTFYTRGVSKTGVSLPGSVTPDFVGRGLQASAWVFFLDGIRREVISKGGTLVEMPTIKFNPSEP